MNLTLFVGHENGAYKHILEDLRYQKRTSPSPKPTVVQVGQTSKRPLERRTSLLANDRRPSDLKGHVRFAE